jgi:hypothetical protein
VGSEMCIRDRINILILDYYFKPLRYKYNNNNRNI